VRPFVQGHNGCAAFPWRFNLDGYLREVLTARVYDVAVRRAAQAQLGGAAVVNTPQNLHQHNALDISLKAGRAMIAALSVAGTVNYTVNSMFDSAIVQASSLAVVPAPHAGCDIVSLLPQVQSPLEKAEKLSDALGNDILLKREDLQPVFSFKLRGAFNKMAKLPQEALPAGCHHQQCWQPRTRRGTGSCKAGELRLAPCCALECGTSTARTLLAWVLENQSSFWQCAAGEGGQGAERV